VRPSDSMKPLRSDGLKDLKVFYCTTMLLQRGGNISSCASFQYFFGDICPLQVVHQWIRFIFERNLIRYWGSGEAE
jgi:hypothetical protein